MANPVAEKEILKPAAALKKVGETAAEDAKGTDGSARSKGALPVPPKYKFVKNFGVANVLRFEDGTTFQFRKIERNTGGFQSNSFVETNDEKLAENLRAASKNKALGVMQVR